MKGMLKLEVRLLFVFLKDIFRRLGATSVARRSKCK